MILIINKKYLKNIRAICTAHTCSHTSILVCEQASTVLKYNQNYILCSLEIRTNIQQTIIPFTVHTTEVVDFLSKIVKESNKTLDRLRTER